MIGFIERVDPGVRVKWLRIASLAVFVAGVAIMVGLAVTRPFTADVSDFGRDLIGAEAVNHGLSPYQQLGRIVDALPHIEIPDGTRAHWVAHTPLAVVGARLALAVSGNNAEAHFQILIIAASAVFLVLAYRTWTGNRTLAMALIGAIGLTPALPHDFMWLQGAALAALLLLAAIELAARGRRGMALVLMAVLVAWKPWSAPLALFLPGARSPFLDAAKVGAGAVGVTFAALPFLGGFHVLRDWLTEALPANTSMYLIGNWNLSLISRWMGGAGSLIVVGAIAVALVVYRDRLTPGQARVGVVLAILAFSPLVWPWYWIALLPALLHEAPEGRIWWVVSGLLAMAFPITLWEVAAVHIGSLAGVVVVWLGLVEELRASGSERHGGTGR